MLVHLQHLIYPRLLTEFGMLVFFTNLSLIEFWINYLTLVFFQAQKSSSSSEWEVVTSMKFLNIPLLVLHFSCYTLMAFLMFVSVILLSMLVILLYTLNENRTSDLWQQLKLASDLQNTRAEYGFLISMLENSACFVWPVKYDWCYYVKTAGSVLQRKSPFKIPELPFSSKSSLGSHIISVTKTAYKKIGALICSIKFLSPKVALYLFKSAI